MDLLSLSNRLRVGWTSIGKTSDFFNPAFVPHKTKLLPNVTLPPAVLTPADLSES
eukprot:COSAG06_NODE_36417_length_447_cov_1.094828_1_plen_54_part_10